MFSFADKLNERMNASQKKESDSSSSGSGNEGGSQGNRKQGGQGDKFAAAVDKETKNYQFTVDVIQTPDEVLVVAPVAGADPSAFEITIDRENDIVTIKGSRKMPTTWNAEIVKRLNEQGKYVQQECKWEPFFRKVILPAEVEVFQSHAYFENGVLLLHLPVMKIKENKNLNVEVVDAVHRPNISDEK